MKRREFLAATSGSTGAFGITGNSPGLCMASTTALMADPIKLGGAFDFTYSNGKLSMST